MGLLKRRRKLGAQLGISLEKDYGALVALKKSPGQARPQVLLAEAFVRREQTLQELRQQIQINRFSDDTVVGVGVPGQYALLQVEPPHVPDDELAEAVRWQLRDLVDFPVESAVVDLFPVPEIPHQPRLAYAAAAPVDAFSPLIHLIDQLDLACDTIDIAELALAQLLRLHPDQEGGVGGLYLTRSSGLLIIVLGGALYFARGLSIGTDRLQMEAETGDALNLLILELQRSLDYFEGSVLRSQIRSLQIFPTEVEIPGLAEQLNRQMTLGVTALNLFDLLDFVDPVEPVELYRCLLPLGAAFREAEVR